MSMKDDDTAYIDTAVTMDDAKRDSETIDEVLMSSTAVVSTNVADISDDFGSTSEDMPEKTDAVDNGDNGADVEVIG